MSVITPAPVPASNDNFYKEIEQLQSKVKVDVEKEYKRLKKQTVKKEQH
ncbi:hypothetical protein [Lactococcus lactis]|nr:hypothetical protein [Lactococcus lactis]KSU16095.1 hypothetical protein LMG9446_0570 [Lactococcus lactis subsp. lactis]